MSAPNAIESNGMNHAAASPTAEYLQNLTTCPPSKDALSLLSGQVAEGMLQLMNANASHQNGATDGPAPQDGGAAAESSHCGALYLQAAARHLATLVVAAPPAPSAVEALMEPVAMPGGGAASAGSSSVVSSSSTQVVCEIVQAIGAAVLLCSPPVICQSGILPVLASLLPSSQQSSTAPNGTTMTQASCSTLSNLHVEFLQACLSAEQYAYAQDAIDGDWPRPATSSLGTAVSVRQVLRYFYLRGSVHVGCGNWHMAIRCFWTCLSVPADNMVSAIVLAAWKKMVLVQCLLHADAEYYKKDHERSKRTMASLLALPRAVPSCVERFLNQARSASGKSDSLLSSSGALPVRAGASSSQAAVLAPAPEEDHRRLPQQQSNQIDVIHRIVGPDNDSAMQAEPPSGGPQNLYLGVQVYFDLVKAFCEVDRTRFEQTRERHAALLTHDGNQELIEQCQSELIRRQIYQVARIYTVISLDELSAKVGMAAAPLQSLLLQLAAERSWHIQIQEDGMVVFPKLVATANAAESQPAMVQDLMRATQMVQSLDAAIAATPRYHAIVRRDARSGKSGTAGDKGVPRGVEDL